MSTSLLFHSFEETLNGKVHWKKNSITHANTYTDVSTVGKAIGMSNDS